jgi:hypothetical protein
MQRVRALCGTVGAPRARHAQGVGDGAEDSDSLAVGEADPLTQNTPASVEAKVLQLRH